MARKKDAFCDRRWRIWGGPQVGESRLVKVNQANFFLKRGCKCWEAGNGTTGWRMWSDAARVECGARHYAGGRPEEVGARNGPMPGGGKSDKTKPFLDPFRQAFRQAQGLRQDIGWRIWGGDWVGGSNLIKVNQTKSGRKDHSDGGEWRNGTRSWRIWSGG